MAEEENLFTRHNDRTFWFDYLAWDKLKDVWEDKDLVDNETYKMILETGGELVANIIGGNAQRLNTEEYQIIDQNGNVYGNKLSLDQKRLEEFKDGLELRIKDINAYQIKDNRLVWPDAATENYNTLLANGFVNMTVSPAYGGLGLPNILSLMIGEMSCSKDAGIGTISGLTEGTNTTLEKLASDYIKKKFLIPATDINNKHTGAMALTESNAGSDLGRVVTKAEFTEENKKDIKEYKINGEKIFITNGGADLTLVLARDADTWEEHKGTTKGLSLYLVPKELDGKDNNIKVTNLEHKLGIHSSPTCTVLYEDSIGYRIGD